MPRLVFALTRRALLAAVCALAAHAAAYGTLWPQDGMHGYLGWYEPLVAALSLAAIAGLAVFLAAAVVARRRGRRVRLPDARIAERPVGALALQIAASGLLYLTVQESLERSIAESAPRAAALSPVQWLVVFAALGSAALVLAVAMRIAGVAVCAALGRPPAPVEDRDDPAWSIVVGERRRPRPLAVGFALRAPPLLLQA